MASCSSILASCVLICLYPSAALRPEAPAPAAQTGVSVADGDFAGGDAHNASAEIGTTDDQEPPPPDATESSGRNDKFRGSYQIPIEDAAYDEEDQRVDMCERKRQIRAGDRELKDALEGLTLTFAFELSNTAGWMDKSNFYDREQKKIGGYSALLIRDLAEQAKFTPVVKYVPFLGQYGKSGNASKANNARSLQRQTGRILAETAQAGASDEEAQYAGYDAWIHRNIKKYDVLAGMLLATPKRMEESGAFAPYPLVDSSVVLVSSYEPRTEFRWTMVVNFLRPFTVGVWLAFLILCVLTGVLMWLIEKQANPEMDDDDPKEAVFSTIQTSFMSAILIREQEPQTVPGKILVCSWVTTSFLVLSFYSAMLITFAVVEYDAPRPWNSLSSFMESNLKLCVSRHSVPIMNTRFQEYKNWQLERDALSALSQGKCDGALTSKYSLTLAEVDEKTNPNCRLQLVEEIKKFTGGWLVSSEPHDKCTNLIRKALEVQFNLLQLKGHMADDWETTLSCLETRDSTCHPPVQLDTTPEPLGMRAGGGALFFHFLLCLVACCWQMRKTAQHI